MAHYDNDDDYDFETPVEETARRIMWAIAIAVAGFVAWLIFG